jgi:hypothetical protein
VAAFEVGAVGPAQKLTDRKQSTTLQTIHLGAGTLNVLRSFHSSAAALCLPGMTVIDGACLLRKSADLHHLLTVNQQEQNDEQLPNLHDR